MTATSYRDYFRARDQLPLRGASDSVDDRRTPAAIFDPLHREFDFTLDAAASADNAKCARYFAPPQDALAESWAGERVWCNPPYSHLAPWVAKAALEAATAQVIVMLIPANRTEQRFWQEMIEPHRDGRGQIETRFVAGRINFDYPPSATTTASGSPFGCVLVIWHGEAATQS